MTEATYAAMREFIKVSVELEVGKATSALRDETRALRDELQTRATDVTTKLEAVLREEMGRVEHNSPPGKDGKDGEPGPAGKDGAPGLNGRDGKDGIATREELRAEVAKAVAASGPMVQKQVAAAIDALPILQYEGVFREGTTYKAGECVTWAGSMWHANAVTQEKPGEGKTAWTLMVKRGDKGKDAT